jgi:hypothetical protein
MNLHGNNEVPPSHWKENERSLTLVNPKKNYKKK